MEDGFLQDKEIFVLVVIGIIVMLLLAFALVLFFYQFQRKLLAQELKTQEQLVYNTLHAQEEERQRIARELHDEIGSKLNVIHLYLHRLKKIKSKETEFEDTFTTTKDILHKTIHATREIAHFLMPVTLNNFGLASALEELCNEFEAMESTDVVLKTDMLNNTFLTQNMELDLFRICQELLNNAVKHAEAKTIYLEAILQQDKFFLLYRDDGKGFDASDQSIQKGLGMKNIRNRLETIGAKWELETSPGNGLQLKAELKK